MKKIKVFDMGHRKSVARTRNVHHARAVSMEAIGSVTKKKSPVLSKMPKTPKNQQKIFIIHKAKAAIKIALRCQQESKYELIQGFIQNIQSGCEDMGVINATRYILPKIILLLVNGLFYIVGIEQAK